MSEPAQSAGQEFDLLHHLVDSKEFEVFGHHFHIPAEWAFKLFGQEIAVTKHVIMMWIAAGLMLIIFPIICNSKSLVPRGLRNFFEAILLFIRDDIVYSSMGKEDGDKFLSYMWSLFFFVLFCNLLGLVPFSATATGNIVVTATLAVLTFIITHVAGIYKNGLGHYLGSIVPPVPWWIWPLMLVIEIASHIIKPCALAIRLFANMLAGHAVLFSVLGFIFLFPNPLTVVGSLVGVCFVYLLEILVAFIQAYVFTFLTAVFIGSALHPDH